MKVLGISGMHRSMDYKASLLGHVDPRFYRICQGMDSAAALIVNGKVIAAVEEERLDRKKHSNRLPVKAMQFCLNEAGYQLEDMDLLVHSYNYAHYRNIYKMIPGGKDWYTHVYSPEIIKADIQEAFASSFDDKKFTCLDHHLSHAASAYYCSHYENALIIVADGMGELKGVSIYLAKDNEINILHSINFNNSIGILYSLLTFHMGFDFNADEYKTMGLAPYGNPEKYLPILEKWVHYDENNGSFSLSFIQHEPDQFSRETYANTRKFLSEQLFEARHPDHDLNQNHKDLAASLQVITNRIMCYLARHWMKKTKQTHLCMAGGVALNCVANEKVLELEEVHHLFVQPAAGDDGAALGAAMYFASKEDPIEKLEQPYIGPNLDIEETIHVFHNFEIKTDYKKYHHNSKSDAAMYIAELLAKGKIIGLYQGKMEFGPRALGNRSILADPRDPEMRDRVNDAVKMREAFRPFAPVVMEEHLDDIFEPVKGADYRYMLITLPVRPEYRDKLPAITHVDGSARLQTINRKQNPYYYEIIKAFYVLSGMPVLLNTSFNVKGQVIVHTPAEAVNTFCTTGIDAVFLDTYEITKLRPS